MISGDTQSGKSSLAKMLFAEAFRKGDLPVLIDGTDNRFKHATFEKIADIVDAELCSQYRCSSPEYLRQVPRNKRTILIDDSHAWSQYSAKQRNLLIAALGKCAGRLMLFAHDVTVGIDELLSPDSGVTFRRYRLLPLGHVSRTQLTERWFSIGAEGESSEDLLSKLRNVKRTVDSVIGKNYILPYPAYILSMLQAFEASIPISTSRASTHGYFYDLLIRAALLRGKGGAPFDILSAYLSYVAYHMFEKGLAELDHDSWKALHTGFCQSRDLEYEYGEIKAYVTRLEVMQQVGDVYRFKYRYYFHYFTASYMRDFISKPEVRRLIEQMIENLHVNANSNALLFLTHLSKDPFIVEKLLEKARGLYADEEPANMESDVSFLDEHVEEWMRQRFLHVFRDGDPRESQRKLHEAQDKQTQAELVKETDSVADGSVREVTFSSAEDTNEIHIYVKETVSAITTAHILGQIVKNFPGSLEGPVKRDIVNECTNLVLRFLSFLLRLLGNDQSRIIEECVELIKDPAHPAPYADLVRDAKAMVFGLASIASYGAVKHVSYAVGSAYLAKTYESVFGADGTPARKLIHTSIRLDHFGAFPVDRVMTLSSDLRDARFAQMLLRGLVIQHFHLFPVEIRTKQRICSALDIQYKGTRVDPRAKRLKK